MRNLVIILAITTIIVLVFFSLSSTFSSLSSQPSQPSLPSSPPYCSQFLDPEDFLKVIADFRNRRGNLRRENFGNVQRENLFVPRDSVTYEILEKYAQKLRDITGNPRIHLARNHPIEYRVYTPGSFMKRHRDVQLYRQPQYECILTLFNTTDSQTLFYFSEDTTLRISPAPNSLMFVRANDVPHEVLPVGKGERHFIKFIMTETEERL